MSGTKRTDGPDAIEGTSEAVGSDVSDRMDGTGAGAIAGKIEAEGPDVLNRAGGTSEIAGKSETEGSDVLNRAGGTSGITGKREIEGTAGLVVGNEEEAPGMAGSDGLSAKEKPSKERGLVLVYTGDGKGKTTAAMGLAARATGRGHRVLAIQFIKSPQRSYGEQLALQKLGVEIVQTGIGFTWTKTPEEHREALRSGWELAKRRILHGEERLIILDEINNALAIDRFPVDDVLSLQEVLDVIRRRPQGMHLVLTGRDAHPDIIAAADLVTEMKAIKHYYDEGVPAVLGIEM